MRNIPTDHEILDAVNARAVEMVNADLKVGERPLPPGFRCDMSRVRFIRERWELAVEEYRDREGIDPIEALARIEALLRRNATVLHVDQR
jgi:hypothetical protein